MKGVFENTKEGMVTITGVETNAMDVAARLITYGGVEKMRRHFVRDRPGLVSFGGFQRSELAENIYLDMHITSIQLLDLRIGH